LPAHADRPTARYQVRSVQRALTILRTFLPHDGELSAADLSKETGLDPSTVFRLLVTLEAQGFADASFDLVTFWNVLECMPEPLPALREARRLLGPGGRLFVRTQNLAWHVVSFRATEAIKRLGLRRWLDRTPHLTFIFNAICFSRATLRLALARAGFDVVRIRNSPPIPGDPYLGLAAPAELGLSLVKGAVFGGAQAVALASGGRWLVAPSLEAWGRVSR